MTTRRNIAAIARAIARDEGAKALHFVENTIRGDVARGHTITHERETWDLALAGHGTVHVCAERGKLTVTWDVDGTLWTVTET